MKNARESRRHVAVQVVVRLRPLDSRELAANETEAIRVSPDDPHTLQVPSTTA